MQEVALRAGVSVATVSRVLAGRQDVAPHLQEKVIQVANELGYRKLRSKSPSSLSANKEERMNHILTGNSKKLVLIYSSLEQATDANYYSPWAKQFRDGLSHGALLNNFQLVYEPLERLSNEPYSHITEDSLAGMIIIPHDDTNVDAFVDRMPASKPIVVVNKYFANDKVPSVDINHYKGAFAVTSFLLRLGHKRIMIFNLEAPAGATENQRLEGYREAFKQANLTVDESLIIREPLGDDWFNWPEIFRDALKLEPSAILLPNHGRVGHAVEIIKNQSLRIPEDVSLITFDDDPTLVKMNPSISAIRQPLDEMGRVAMGLIVKMGTSQTPVSSHTRLETEFVVRGSVAPPGKNW